MIDKDRPSAEWIAEILRRYPCEREIDRRAGVPSARRARDLVSDAG